MTYKIHPTNIALSINMTDKIYPVLTYELSSANI